MNKNHDWTFNSTEIAASFDLHVREQLPWYDMATRAVAHIIRHYLPEYGLIYDIGASNGNIGRSISDVVKRRGARVVAIEKSKEMADTYDGPGICVNADAIDFDFERYNVAVCFLVMMFLPVEDRKQWLQSLSNKIKPGGVMIIVDKTIGYDGYIGTVMRRLTIDGKISAGADPKDVIEKELSLSGVQRPVPLSLINSITPKPVEVFRFGEFVGWVVESPE